ncbi:fimbrial biogenesis outer membrane usher protein [Pseudomonas savastanoi]|uniref:Outer-membrane fimbrial usher protein n=1 Tax=Pseudomonas savastanoi pv. glycinea TaxID=318 RepID=A0A3M3FTM0_PSESG|nr:fimbrial biogenesis outer membrane usher protein [Pseudomonas savastanoi]RMM65250.1 Outer-membrane fimbrial usher protein [Pseudomonas savastanoi pv. glycinea]
MRRLAYALSLPAACFFTSVQAQTYHFDPALLGGSAKHTDLSLFNRGLQQPGRYHLDVMLNDEQVDSQDITLSLKKNAAGISVLDPCLSLEQLSRWGIKTEAIPGLNRTSNAGACVILESIPESTVNADIANQQLQLQVPQSFMRPNYRGLAPQGLWDDGITAFLMNYSAGASRVDSRDIGANDTSSWAQLQPGFNLGPWRARSSFSWKDGGDLQRSYAYVERGVRGFKSRLSLGERTSPGDVFDGVPFTGVMLATDDTMFPASERSFAPTVSGVALTRARIEVRQNGYIIKTLSVPPGPFEIQDLAASSGNGDLHVAVYEADGRNQFFIVPWNTPAIALHKDHLKYSVTAGRYRSAESRTPEALLIQATAIYGLPWNLTGYGGLQGATHYGAASLGVGAMLGGWGAVSVDATGSRSQTPGGNTQGGLKWRLRYSTQLPLTHTAVSLASMQYASAGYRSLTETLGSRQREEFAIDKDYSGRRQRARSTLSLSQKLGPLGSLGISASRTDWRYGQGHDDGMGFSWSKSIHSLSVSIEWQQNRSFDGCQDRTLSVWVSIPIGGSTNASWTLTAPTRGQQEQEGGLNGRAFEDRLAWDVRQRYRTDVSSDQRSGSDLHASWNGASGQVGVGYGYSATSRQANMDVSGGVIVHHDGVTLSQQLSDTVALVSAPGAAGVQVEGWPGVETDRRGYTVTSNLVGYQENTVSLNPITVPDNAEIPQTDVKIVPTAGAVVEAAFRTRTGAKALVTLHYSDGSPVAFGSQVTAEGREGNAGITDAKGLAYLTGLSSSGTLSVRSGNKMCHANYDLPGNKETAGLYQLDAVCLESLKKEIPHG